MSMSLDARQKSYEEAWNHKLPPRLPKIAHIESVAYHTLLEQSSFVEHQELVNPLVSATKKVMNHFGESARFAFVSFGGCFVCFNDYYNPHRESVLGNNITKLTSTTSAVFTQEFNQARGSKDLEYVFCTNIFCLPESELVNYFIFRQSSSAASMLRAMARNAGGEKQASSGTIAEVEEFLSSQAEKYPDGAPSTYDEMKRRCCVVIRGENGKLEEFWHPPIFSEDRKFIVRSFAVQPQKKRKGA